MAVAVGSGYSSAEPSRERAVEDANAFMLRAWFTAPDGHSVQTTAV